jgi:hypothetical protein
MQFVDYALPRSYISTTFCLPRNLGVCEYAATPCTCPCHNTNLAGDLIVRFKLAGIYVHLRRFWAEVQNRQVLQIAGDV